MTAKQFRGLILVFTMAWFSLRSACVLAESDVADVLIIGGGLSGLTTAFQLKKAGKSFVLLEMSPHIGGRIRTANYFGNTYAEVGLEEFWENNPLVEILRELDVPLETSYTSFSSFYYQGRLHPFTHDSNLEFLAAFADGDEMDAYRKWDSKMTALFRQLEHRPLPEELMALKEVSFAEWMKTTSGLSPKLIEFVRIETEPEYGTSWRKISALDGIAEWHLFSGDGLSPRHVVGGNQRAVEVIADFVGRENIRLQQLVTHIRADDNGIEVTATDQASFRQNIFRARYVVNAIPLYKLTDIQFTPPLTADRNTAILSQSAGAYFTAHVQIDGKADIFWKRNGKSILPILTDGPLGVIYEGHSEVGQDALLNLLITGADAERFNSRIASDEIRETLLEAFEKIWPGVKPAVKKMTFYRYHPRAIPSWPVGRSRFDLLSDIMRQPQGRIYFAGDFTEDTHSNGAATSAIRVTKDILLRLE